MKKATEKALRQRLLAERTELAALSAGSRADRAPVELDQQSVGRLSRMDAMQVQAMALEAERRRQTRLKRIDAALERLGTDDYGFCLDCGEAIEPKRLALDPTATLCTDCMQERG